MKDLGSEKMAAYWCIWTFPVNHNVRFVQRARPSTVEEFEARDAAIVAATAPFKRGFAAVRVFQCLGQDADGKWRKVLIAERRNGHSLVVRKAVKQAGDSPVENAFERANMKHPLPISGTREVE
jgi:hypothetical protein